MLFNQRMTRNTHRDNIKPMFFIISFMMVILACLTPAIYALQCGNLWNFLFSDSIVYFISCFIFIREFLSLFFSGFYSALIEFFNLIFCHILKTSQLNLFDFLGVSFSPRNASFDVFLFVCFVIFQASLLSAIWIISTRLNACNSMTRFASVTESIFRSARFDKFTQFLLNITTTASFHKTNSNI